MSTLVNFVRQQGFRDLPVAACPLQYSALMWQPRVVGLLLVLGVILQAWAYFLVLAVVLAWCSAVPALNPFDAIHNALKTDPGSRLGPAPAPRRFAQFLAGAFMLAISLSLLYGMPSLAWVLEAFLALAIGLLVFARFCVGSFFYLLITGQGRYAMRTAPWARSEQ